LTGTYRTAHGPRGATCPALRVGAAAPGAEISSPGGWECYLEDLFEAGQSVLTDGALDPVKINPIAAK
jgi:hypothetical protein